MSEFLNGCPACGHGLSHTTGAGTMGNTNEEEVDRRKTNRRDPCRGRPLRRENDIDRRQEARRVKWTEDSDAKWSDSVMAGDERPEITINRLPPLPVAGPDGALNETEPMPDDPWRHRGAGMRCSTCMWYAVKVLVPDSFAQRLGVETGRCRRRAPTMNGYPVVYPTDWCGDHKVDETKL